MVLQFNLQVPPTKIPSLPAVIPSKKQPKKPKSALRTSAKMRSETGTHYAKWAPLLAEKLS